MGGGCQASGEHEQGSMLGIATAVGSLARFVGPIVMGFMYDLAQARGAFYAGAALTGAAFIVALTMRGMPLSGLSGGRTRAVPLSAGAFRA